MPNTAVSDLRCPARAPSSRSAASALRGAPLFSPSQYPFTARLHEYVEDVLSGAIPACKWVRLACERHLKDLEAAAAGSPYRFEPTLVERICGFGSRMRHTKGDLAGQPIHLEPWQVFILGSIFGWVRRKDGKRRFREAFILVPRKNGKALAVETPVATPEGWKRHGDLRPGDRVFAPNGDVILVEAVTEHYDGPCMAVEFSDGEHVVAHEQHEWDTQRTWYTKREKWEKHKPLPTITTKEISETLRGGLRGDFVHRIPVAGPLATRKAELPIPPYVLGAWLGDGTSRTAQLTCADKEIVAHINTLGVETHQRSAKGEAVTYLLGTADRTQAARDQSVQARLRAIGVLQNKHIPLCYLRGSYGQRLELLRGLIDTDGHITKRGQIEVVSIYPELVRGIEELVRSLGMKPQTSLSNASCNGKNCGTAYRVCFFPHENTPPLAYVVRKRERQTILGGGKRRSNGRTVVGVYSVGVKTVNCIQVTGGRYLAGNGMVPTHNSVLAAVVGLYTLVADGEKGGEVYSGATSEKQAMEVFRPAWQMVYRDPRFREKFNLDLSGTIKNPGPIFRLADSARFEAVIGKPGDGASPSCGIVDEYHEHKAPDLYDTLLTGMGARSQPLLFVISTAGVDTSVPCYDKQKDAEKILEGSLSQDDLFAIVYGLDADDDWTDFENWKKANPNFGISINEDFLLARLKEAMSNPARKPVLLTKHTDTWQNAGQAWMDMLKWEGCKDSTLTLDAFAGQDCWIGLDLANRIDITALRIVFCHEDGYAGFGRYYLPEDTIRDEANSHYRQWLEQGWLVETDGATTDFHRVLDDLAVLCGQFNVRELAYDPREATFLIQEIQKQEWAGFDCVEILQNPANLSEPTKEFERLIYAGEYHHNGDPVMTWMMSNCVLKQARGGGPIKTYFLTKERNAAKIDGPVAEIMALSRALRTQREAFIGVEVWD